MKGISIDFKDSVLLSFVVIAFFLLTASVSTCLPVGKAFAAEPDTSKPKDCKLHGFTEGAGETAAGLVKGTDEVMTGMAEGFDQSAKGFGTGAKESLYGFIDGSGKVIAGVTGQKASKSSEGQSEETTVK